MAKGIKKLKKPWGEIMKGAELLLKKKGVKQTSTKNDFDNLLLKAITPKEKK